MRTGSNAERSTIQEEPLSKEDDREDTLTEEELLRRRRTSLLDNRRNRYVIDTGNNILHDRECELVKDIPDHAFDMCSELEDAYHLCRKCGVSAYIRLAMGDDGKRIGIYRHYFRRVNAGENLLRELTVKNHAKLYLVEQDVMRIKVREDSWLVRLLTDGKVTLFHNNYIMLQDGTRYFNGGYHNQIIGGDNTFYHALQIIYDYSWEQHLKARGEREQLEAEASQPQADLKSQATDLQKQESNELKINRFGRNKLEINSFETNKLEINRHELNRHEINRHELNRHGLNRLGLNRHGLNRLGLNRLGLNRHGLNRHGLNKLELNKSEETKPEVKQTGLYKTKRRLALLWNRLAEWFKHSRK